MAEMAKTAFYMQSEEALTDTENIRFEDLFDLKDIQRLQDDFSSATGVASIITQVDGTPITRPSNFCRLCNNIIRKTEKGNANCRKSDAVLGKLSPTGPIAQPCLSGGLWDAGAGIAVGGKHIANWLLGQVRDETQTDAKMREYAREIGVDEQDFLAAFHEVPAMTRVKFDKIALALYTLANQLSVLAWNNVQQARLILQRNQTEEALRQARDSLERQVEERTQELFAANQELRAMNEEFIAMNEDINATNDQLRAVNSELQRENIERKRAEQELKQAYAELKNAQAQIIQQEKLASIGQLAAGVAHEINNPMGFIISNVESLQDYTGKVASFLKTQGETVSEMVKFCVNERGNEKIAVLFQKLQEEKRSLKIDYIMSDLEELIKETLDGADRVKTIVQDLKSFARIADESNMLADINAGIESTINIIWNELKYKATMVKEYGDIPLAKCNQAQLNQVFMNILMNAAQAIEKQGEVRIKTWTEGRSIFVSIADTGCGIPADVLNRIFEPFFTTKEIGKGTGLGLSVSHEIIKKHGGEIHVDSDVGKGTTFIVKIPIETE
jgi:signal transduction histidine kinase